MINLNDSLPAPTSGNTNVAWQKDSSGNVSAQFPTPINATTQAVHKALIGPVSGSDAVPTFRVLDATDIPNIAESQVTNLTTDLAAKASLASPALTGTPTAPTATGTTNTTQIATTAFVQGRITDLINAAPSALDTLGEIATQLASDESAAAALTTSVAAKAPINSPALTGTPTAPTASTADNSTQIATTAYVQAQGYGTGSGDATRVGIQQQLYTYAADSGAANAYAVTLSPTPTIVAGSVVVFKATNANTGASTLAVNGGTATAIKKSGSTALASGDIVSSQIVQVVYDGTNFQLVGGAGSGAYSGQSVQKLTFSTSAQTIWGSSTVFASDQSFSGFTHLKLRGPVKRSATNVTIAIALSADAIHSYQLSAQSDGNLVWYYNSTTTAQTAFFASGTGAGSNMLGNNFFEIDYHVFGSSLSLLRSWKDGYYMTDSSNGTANGNGSRNNMDLSTGTFKIYVTVDSTANIGNIYVEVW